MARRSLRIASSPITPRKRSAAPTPTTDRGSKHAKSTEKASRSSGRVTSKKSRYFEDDVSPSEAESPPSTSSDAETSESGYEDEEDASAVASEATPSESEDYQVTEDEKPKKRGRVRPSKSGETADASSEVASVKTKKLGKELWREGVKTGLGPGKQVFIKLPKARSPGRTPYEDGTIHPNTMAFLADLKKNNDREWMKLHDADYRASRKDWDSFVESLTEKIIEKDSTIPELPAKDLTFRIYRDIRFTKDPTPYKPHFSAAWSRTGRKGPYAAYYVQIGDNGSFVGAGLWMPEAGPLAKLRRNVDRKPRRIREVLMNARIRKEILGGVPNDEKKVIKAFVERNKEGALKSKPKGYEADNPSIEILRLRNYTMGKRLRDDEIIEPKVLDKIADILGVMEPFVTYLNSVVMPDDDESSDDSSGDDQEQEATSDDEE